MEKKKYVFPWSQTMSVQIQTNWMSSGAVDTISDSGLPGLESDDTTLGWIDD